MNIIKAIAGVCAIAVISAGVFASVCTAEVRGDVSPAVHDLLSQGYDSPNPCASLVKECFAYNGDRFLGCLKISSNHPFCESTPLGALVSKRWEMAPSKPSLDEADKLLGPQLVNRECLQNFDLKLSAHMGTEFSSKTIEMLNQSLDACRQEPPADLLRP